MTTIAMDVRDLEGQEFDAVCGANGVTEGGCIPDMPWPFMPQQPTLKEIIAAL